MRVENNIIALIIAIQHFLEGLSEIHLKPFLAGWPSTKSMTRSVLPHSLPVLSYLPAVVKAAGKKTEVLVNMLSVMAKDMTWGQTYSARDFGVGFLEKYGWTELFGLRGPIASNRMACGFLFLGPGVAYRQHRHEAEEI